MTAGARLFANLGAEEADGWRRMADHPRVRSVARLWAALSGVGLSTVVLLAGRRWFDARTATIAAAMVATTFGYFSIGRLALPDLPLAFFVTVTICGALAAGPRSDRFDLRRDARCTHGMRSSTRRKGSKGRTL